MGKQIYYVACIDLDSETWWLDDEMFNARFGRGEGTWDTETKQWQDTQWDDHITAIQILNKGKDS